eukprot:m.53075 g.53075  ORF g.53075 m.53075 type:complete len:739 (-) comp7652_c0_seq1:124-2340(-)
MNVKDDPESRAEKLLSQMTLDEKITMVHGWQGGYVGNVPENTRLGIPALKLNDGPQGFRDNAHLGTTTAWPSGLTVAATFNQSAMFAWGEAMGEEFYNKGANVQLGPGMCLARVPVNGRNFEYLAGEDPFLGYTLSQPTIKGIQSKGVIANAKHYVNNNQETNRGSVSENVDERTRFEMYYPPFEGAIEADVGSFMCSYNKINNVWSCENNGTLATDLKILNNLENKRFWVMSDWGATHSTSIREGLDQEMPSDDFMGGTLKAMIVSGVISNATLDNSLMNILTPMFAVGLFDYNNTNTLSNNVTTLAHNALARQLSAESHVLLKNDGVLPLNVDSVQKIGVFGAQAYSNVIVHGGGSGQVIPYYVSTPLDAIRKRYGIDTSKTPCSNVQYLNNIDFYQPGNPSSTSSDASDCCAQCQARPDCNVFTYTAGECYFKETTEGRVSSDGRTSGILATPSNCNGDKCVYFSDGSNLTYTQTLAQEVDVAVVFVATTSSEGSDRNDLTLGNGQEDLISVVASAAKKTVVVVTTPGAILTDWREEVNAIVTNFMPGQEFGNAATEVLFGDVNPSAKLPLTFPNIENEVGFTVRQYPGLDNAAQAYYDEELLVGYRWYDARGVTPAFPFGHGLSYTTFHYSDLAISGMNISATITNTGSVAGAEVPQLYLGFPSSAGEPPQQLKGFEKVHLGAGQSTTVTFNLRDRDLSIWDVNQHAWSKVKGSYSVSIGASSRDFRLNGSMTV